MNNYLNLKNTKYSIDIDDYEILYILEKLGFPMNRPGTYMYKKVIKSIIDYLNIIKYENNYDELIDQLDNPFSQLYFNISRNELQMGLKTFHTIVSNSLLNTNYKKLTILEQQYEKNDKCEFLNYGRQALFIALYINNDKSKSKNSKSCKMYCRNLVKL